MLRDDNIEDEDQARDLIDGLRAQLGEHVLVAIDDEGGRVSALGALGESIPSARRLGVRGADASREAGEELGTLASSIGVDWVLAPVTDLDDGPADGVIGDRSFGGDADEVIAAAGAFIDGAEDAGLAVTLKHFPGDGGDGDPHTGMAVSDATLEDLRTADLAVFQALASQADAVMVGHVQYPNLWSDDRPASLQPDAYRLLRSTGFDGLAITDALGMGAVHARWGFDVAPSLALAAGADAVLVTQGDAVEALHDGIVQAVEEGRLDEDRLDDAVRHVLTLAGAESTGIVCDPPA
jgi:beta-N-acetylhexosaminidase